MPKTLLLADNSVVIQKLVGLSFANEDVELITTDNGDDAIAKAREHKPDAILADVVMPGMSGYEVCEAVKSDPELQSTPVLLLTGTFEAFDESRAQEVGSDGHITKPFEAQALVDRVNALFAVVPSAAQPPTTPGAGTGSDDTYDFFDDGVSDLSASSGTDITRTATASQAAPAASQAAPGTRSDSDSAFDFGADPADADPLVDGDLLGEPVDLDQGLADPGSDQTIVVSNDSMGDPLADPMASGPDALESDAFASPAAEPARTLTASAYANDLDPLAAPLDAPSTALPVDDTFAVDAPRSAPETHTTVIMSDGDSSSAGIALGAEAKPPAAPASEQTMLADDLFSRDADPIAMRETTSSETPEVAPDIDFEAPAIEPLPSEIPAVEPPALAMPSIDATSDDFDFGDTDPMEAGTPAEPLATEADGGADAAFAPPLASDYDVSSSDLGDPFAVAPPPVVDLDAEAPAVPAVDEPSGMSISDGLLGSSMAVGEAIGDAAHEAEFEVDSPAAAAAPEVAATWPSPESPDAPATRAPDITPVMRDRIHETLERVAWEAFADLSETMVKQVLERVEAVAWEVIPQMAEALIKEEIRRMKGDDED